MSTFFSVSVQRIREGIEYFNFVVFQEGIIIREGGGYDDDPVYDCPDNRVIHLQICHTELINYSSLLRRPVKVL